MYVADGAMAQKFMEAIELIHDGADVSEYIEAFHAWSEARDIANDYWVDPENPIELPLLPHEKDRILEEDEDDEDEFDG